MYKLQSVLLSRQGFKLEDAVRWLVKNGFDPEDKKLTIGHPQVGQVDLQRSFGSTHYHDIWVQMTNYLDVYRVSTSDATATYDYHWSDEDFIERQVSIISQGR